MIKDWRSLFALHFLAATPVHALIIEVNPVAILNAAAPTQNQNGGSLGWTGDAATGFGLLTSFNLFDSSFDLETGAVYLNQLSERDSGGITITQKSHALHIPLLFRYNFDERIGLGLGGYASIAQGGITTAQGTTSTYVSYSSTNFHNRDFGLLFSARASLKIISQLYFIIDGRYQHGLTNLSNGPAGDILNTRSMQAYLGLSYRFMPF